ncbi:unnamed protein product, partial [Scytosiphon promiscuus]
MSYDGNEIEPHGPLTMRHKVELLGRIAELRDDELLTKDHAILLSGAVSRVKDGSGPLMDDIRDFLSMALLARRGSMTAAQLGSNLEQYMHIFSPDEEGTGQGGEDDSEIQDDGVEDQESKDGDEDGLQEGDTDFEEMHMPAQTGAVATSSILVEVTTGGLITNAGRCELNARAAKAVREAADFAGGIGCKVAGVDALRVVDWSGVAEGPLSGDIGAMLIYAGDDFKHALAQS